MCLYIFTYYVFIYISMYIQFLWLSHAGHLFAVICKLRGHGYSGGYIKLAAHSDQCTWYESVSLAIHLILYRRVLLDSPYLTLGPGGSLSIDPLVSLTRGEPGIKQPTAPSSFSQPTQLCHFRHSDTSDDFRKSPPPWTTKLPPPSPINKNDDQTTSFRIYIVIITQLC